MNPTYSLAYSRAGLVENVLSARRDLAIAVVVSLTVHFMVVWVGGWSSPPVFRTPPRQEASVLPFELTLIASDETEASGAAEASDRMSVSLPQLPDLVPLAPRSPFSQPVVRPSPMVMPSVDSPVIVVPGGSRFGVDPGVVELRDLDQAPIPVFQARPPYPAAMRAEGIAGQVVVDFIVDAHGNVQDAYVVASNQREFNASALQAVMKWKFKAGRKAGRAVNAHLQVPINFSLNPD